MKYFVKEGERYERLVVLATHQRVAGKRGLYNLCRCDCGNRCYRTSQELARGLRKSCGCGHRERQKQGNFIHGGSNASGNENGGDYLYQFWLRNRSRCPEEWQKSYASFRDWVEGNLGSRPAPGYRLERWHRGKGFEAGNLLWVTEGQSYALRKGLVA